MSRKRLSHHRRFISAVALALLWSTPAIAMNHGNGNGGGNGGGGNGGGNGGGGPGGEQGALQFLAAQTGPLGLLDSFPSDGTAASYTYDNAMAALALLAAGDAQGAANILDAYNAIPAPSGGFDHRYDANTGASVAGILGVGHNAYLLLAMVLHEDATGEGRYDDVAADVADFLVSQQDADGGLFGRPTVTWKSTENNAASLSALHNYGVVYGSPTHTQAAAAVWAFLANECWDGQRFWAGENDPTIATDVQALGALAMGASFQNGIYWIEPHTLNTQRLVKRVRITGFDLNDDRDTVWTEGTAQQALAYGSVGDTTEAATFQGEIEKAQQASGGFWQASNTGTTGFGENFTRTEAVAATAWYVLVSSGDNPFELLN